MSKGERDAWNCGHFGMLRVGLWEPEDTTGKVNYFLYSSALHSGSRPVALNVYGNLEWATYSTIP